MVKKKFKPFELTDTSIGLSAGLQSLRAISDPLAAASGVTAILPVAVTVAVTKKLLQSKKVL
jgi:hypothetical protein